MAVMENFTPARMRCRTMPRFFFHFVAKTLLEDEAGATFPDAEKALLHARVLAAELAQNDLLAGCAIVVANEAEDELFEIPLTCWAS
jgi:hypothetical protein